MPPCIKYKMPLSQERINMTSTLNLETRVILLRHGQSNYNVLGLYQGNSDRPNLTSLGRQQAQETAHFLKNIKFDAIYSSPLKRATDTAREVIKTIDDAQDLKIVPHLKETELPQWEGLPFEVVKEQFELDYYCWKQKPHAFRMKATEGTEFSPTQELYNRIERFWQETLPKHQGQTILVVSQGGTNRALVSTALGVSPARYHCIEQSNCAVNLLTFRGESSNLVQIKALNRVGHTDKKIAELPVDRGLRLLLVSNRDGCSPKISELSEFLKDVKIDLSISDRQESSIAISDRILLHHPQAIGLQVEREDFLQLWQKDINIQNNSSRQEATTALVIANDRAIQDFLARILEINPARLSSLNLHPGTVSIIHYPTLQHPPSIQGINICGSSSLIPTEMRGEG
jgi:phosphoserine phosphatase